MYRKSVIYCKESEFGNKISQGTLSFDNKRYICHTCQKNLKRGKIPAQAVANKLYVEDIPEELASLNKLESALISKRLLFKKRCHLQHSSIN